MMRRENYYNSLMKKMHVTKYTYISNLLVRVMLRGIEA